MCCACLENCAWKAELIEKQVRWGLAEMARCGSITEEGDALLKQIQAWYKDKNLIVREQLTEGGTWKSSLVEHRRSDTFLSCFSDRVDRIPLM